MEKTILDASIVIKWFVKEEGSDKALTYLESYKQRKMSFLVPTLLFYELGNILLAKRATVRQVGEIMAYMQALNLTLVDIGYEAFRKIFQNAQELGITFYDAAYVTLMQKEDGKFITADRKLYDKLRKKFSRVELL